MRSVTVPISRTTQQHLQGGRLQWLNEYVYFLHVLDFWISSGSDAASLCWVMHGCIAIGVFYVRIYIDVPYSPGMSLSVPPVAKWSWTLCWHPVWLHDVNRNLVSEILHALTSTKRKIANVNKAHWLFRHFVLQPAIGATIDCFPHFIMSHQVPTSQYWYELHMTH